MGNCCRAESSSSSSSMIWAGDDWSSLLNDGGESKRLLGDADRKRVPSSSSRRREIKIKISKKELENLLERIDAEGLSLEQILPLLVNKNCFGRHRSGSVKHVGQRSWRPALESIAEAN